MKKIVLNILKVLGIVVLLIGIVLGLLIYQANYKKTSLVKYESTDKTFFVEIYEIGEPFLFGYSELEIQYGIKNDKKSIREIKKDVANDGAKLSESNFEIEWSNKEARLRIMGSEQGDEICRLVFNEETNIPGPIKSDTKRPADSTEELVDYSFNFGVQNGCSVIYDYQNNKYYVYNEELARTQVSPWSTFKIVSTLIGLNSNVIVGKDTRMGYSGQKYPMSEWNQDLTLEEAFQKSCVWYFKDVIDEVGGKQVQTELSKLKYGNCDISQWEGSGINSFDELNGFWLGSSLKISPFEQTKILADIFEGNSDYQPQDVSLVKDMMIVDTEHHMENKMYGKTGTGINGQGLFVGFTEENEQRYYFAIFIEDYEETAYGTVKDFGIGIMKNFSFELYNQNR